ncbi:MAG: hypothetical protein HY034_01090 [Nitrospirae bacterium]|nr:hypothetical protein [Nitrospirota bacterium]
MYKKIFVIALMMGVILLTSLSFAQIPSPLKDVEVSTTATQDTTTGIYTYNYSIYNPPINDGKIWSFDIDISKPLGGQELNSKGLIIQRGIKADGSMLIRSFEEEIAKRLMRKSVIPVGTQFNGWSSGITVMGTVGWGSSEKTMIIPGKTLYGFIIISRGLPGIRDAMLRPDIDYDNLPEEYWENVELTKQLQDSLIYSTRTIGPTAPPADFKPIEFIDYIINLKHEAYNLGWIVQGRDDDKGKHDDEEEGIMKSLDKKLEKAREELVKGDTREAIEKLKSFIHEVEALYKEGKEKEGKHKKEEGHSHITSEAYALLKYNTMYLIEKLGGEIKEKD